MTDLADKLERMIDLEHALKRSQALEELWPDLWKNAGTRRVTSQWSILGKVATLTIRCGDESRRFKHRDVPVILRDPQVEHDLNNRKWGNYR